eukprot:Nk52_evm29s914 gene=Nk52_evmTU29s914
MVEHCPSSHNTSLQSSKHGRKRFFFFALPAFAALFAFIAFVSLFFLRGIHREFVGFVKINARFHLSFETKANSEKPEQKRNSSFIVLRERCRERYHLREECSPFGQILNIYIETRPDQEHDRELYRRDVFLDIQFLVKYEEEASTIATDDGDPEDLSGLQHVHYPIRYAIGLNEEERTCARARTYMRRHPRVRLDHVEDCQVIVANFVKFNRLPDRLADEGFVDAEEQVDNEREAAAGDEENNEARAHLRNQRRNQPRRRCLERPTLSENEFVSR